MQSGFVGTVCRMGVFLICAQAVVHFRPKAVYEKYLKMLVSAMVLIQLLSGISGLFTKAGMETLFERAQWFAENSVFPVTNSGYDADMIGENTEKWEGEEQTAGGISIEIAPVTEIHIPEVQVPGTKATGEQREATGTPAVLQPETDTQAGQTIAVGTPTIQEPETDMQAGQETAVGTPTVQEPENDMQAGQTTGTGTPTVRTPDIVEEKEEGLGQ